jgi:hypothetical protein
MKWPKKQLPHCDDLFLDFFAPWYHQDDLTRRGFVATLPDVIQHQSFVGFSQAEASLFPVETQSEVLARIDAMLDAARTDWPTFLAVSGEIDQDWVAAFDHHYTRQTIIKTIERSDPRDYGNDYLVTCCEFGAVLGRVLMSREPRLFWRFDLPYWDSTLLDPKTGTAITVFHWAIKKLSSYGVDDGYPAKVNACLHFLAEDSDLGRINKVDP